MRETLEHFNFQSSLYWLYEWLWVVCVHELHKQTLHCNIFCPANISPAISLASSSNHHNFNKIEDNRNNEFGQKPLFANGMSSLTRLAGVSRGSYLHCGWILVRWWLTLTAVLGWQCRGWRAVWILSLYLWGWSCLYIYNPRVSFYSCLAQCLSGTQPALPPRPLRKPRTMAQQQRIRYGPDQTPKHDK